MGFCSSWTLAGQWRKAPGELPERALFADDSRKAPCSEGGVMSFAFRLATRLRSFFGPLYHGILTWSIPAIPSSVLTNGTRGGLGFAGLK